MLERKYFLENGKILNNFFPPQQPFKMNSNETEINFKAFSKLIEDNTLIVTITEINELLKKQNYANLYLNVIGEQIMELNNKIDKIME